jgi:hypothetical protein
LLLPLPFFLVILEGDLLFPHSRSSTTA